MDKFKNYGAFSENTKWSTLINREEKIYKRDNDIRTEFVRDYNRIIHCKAYRRLKHKTQVFFATKNDHICTRIEHVTHVAAVSYTISKYLGLNTELTNAIATGHDIGHAPFGHEGEKVLRELSKKYLNEYFWHEKNSLFFADNVETLSDPYGKQKNLNLTYAVRDGIILHCGEVNENSIFPRKEIIDLYKIERPGQYSPYTWEGCIVKISDKVAYLGRDIEDAVRNKILSKTQMKILKKILKQTIGLDEDLRDINNTVLIHDFTADLCNSSNPEEGLKFSEKYLELINSIKDFNYKYIYRHPRLDNFKKYVRLIIESIFEVLLDLYKGENSLEALRKYKNIYPMLIKKFEGWLIKYSDIDLEKRKKMKYENRIIYRINCKEDYIRAVIHYIATMTDSFAIKAFEELTTF